MPRMLRINHVTLVVDDLAEACRFYEDEFGLEALPAFEFDYPAQFYKINDEQQLHLTEWEDRPSFRGHVSIQVDDFTDCFRRMKARDAIDTAPWGKVRRLPDGGMQMFIRDPSNNLLEIVCPSSDPVDESIFEEELVESEPGAYVSGRGDARGMQSNDATLFHDEESD